MTGEFKKGDRVRRTETHSTGYPEAGYEFTVADVVRSSVWEVGSTTVHNSAKLELVEPAPEPLIVKLDSFAKGGVVTPPTTEFRSVSASGGEKGVKPEEYALIPWEAMDEIAKVYAFGAKKYAAHNWRKGYEWGKSFSALCRHIFAFWRGQDLDPESGLPHLSHAGVQVLTLLTFWLDKKRYGEYDDRHAKPE